MQLLVTCSGHLYVTCQYAVFYLGVLLVCQFIIMYFSMHIK